MLVGAKGKLHDEGSNCDMPVEVTWCWDRIYEAGPGVKIKKANCAWGAAD